MTLSSTAARMLTTIGVLALAGGALSGCTPTPEPSPTPTAAFASEEEAFAAAEEVYREYLTASAAHAEGDESIDPQEFLSGAALESSIDAERSLEESDLRIVGESSIAHFEGIEADVASAIASVAAEICIDISESRVLDADGTDITHPDRANMVHIRVDFAGAPDSLIITNSSGAEDPEC